MHILITGANGQLGSEIRDLASLYKDFNFTFTDIDELNITNVDTLENFFAAGKFNCIINCAGYTAVDKAESEKEQAHLLNATAVKYLANCASKYDALLIHISTDYVYDGMYYKPYTEIDKTNPQSVYGAAKLEGEKEAIAGTDKLVIIRTSWLYSSYGNNFVKTIMKVAKERGALRVVCDQIGCPTYAGDLAKAILDIVSSGLNKDSYDIYNYSNEGVASWYDFAIEITAIAGIPCTITPIETKDYPTPAVRPAFSVFNKAKIKTKFNISIPYWKDSLRVCIEKIQSSKFQVPNSK